MKDIEAIFKFEVRLRLKQNRTKANVTEGPAFDVSLPAFLYSFRDEAKKMIIPNVLMLAKTHLENKGKNRKEAPAIVIALNAFIDIGIQMLLHYQNLCNFPTGPKSRGNADSGRSFEGALKKIFELIKTKSLNFVE